MGRGWTGDLIIADWHAISFFPHVQLFTTVCFAIHFHLCVLTWILKLLQSARLAPWLQLLSLWISSRNSVSLPIGLRTPACDLLRHPRMTKPTNCAHFLWTLLAHVFVATPMECRFCISDTWLVHTLVSEQKRQYHSFLSSMTTSLASSSSLRTWTPWIPALSACEPHLPSYGRWPPLTGGNVDKNCAVKTATKEDRGNRIGTQAHNTKE